MMVLEKSLVLGILSIAMLLFPTSLKELVYAIDIVNVRELPTTDSEKVDKLFLGECVEREQVIGDWALVKMDEETVYIHNNYLSEEDPMENYSYLGEFKITAYCGGSCCNGKWAGQTATGVKPSEGTTIAVAPWVIHNGSEVYIYGIGTRIAHDTGGFANRNDHQIDLFFDSHRLTEEWGVQYRKVWVRK